MFFIQPGFYVQCKTNQCLKKLYAQFDWTLARDEVLRQLKTPACPIPSPTMVFTIEFDVIK